MNKGVIFAFSAYLLWGFFPIYFKLIGIVPPLQILAHRFLWSFIFLAILIVGLKQLPRLKSSITRRILISYFFAGAILAVNWGTYVYAVNSDHVLESSLGYFINPMVSVLLGVIFLKERLRLWQWVPVGLAAIGVIYLTIIFGSIPWIALILAFSFGLYGLIKKLSPLDSLSGLTLETGLLFIPAVAFLGYHEISGSGSFGHTGLWIGFLLALSGVVTAIPLLLFAAGTKRINLTTIGILQYITPSIQFLLGAFLFKEPFDINRLVGFGLIWIALIIFTGETLLNQRNKKHLPVVVMEVAIPE
ncbi:MAG: EamA family transporter RarD [Leptolinea sp.]|nr:EamA family transporter RarD [Leptolinea sp.]